MNALLNKGLETKRIILVKNQVSVFLISEQRIFIIHGSIQYVHLLLIYYFIIYNKINDMDSVSEKANTNTRLCKQSQFIKRKFTYS